MLSVLHNRQLTDDHSQLFNRPLESSVGSDHLVKRQLTAFVKLIPGFPQPFPLKFIRLPFQVIRKRRIPFPLYSVFRKILLMDFS